MSSALNSKLIMMLLAIMLLLATSALAFTSSPTTRSQLPSPLFASTVGSYNTNTRRMPRSRVVQDKILQYLERREAHVEKEHSRAAKDIRELNAELYKIRIRKEDYLQQSQGFVTATSFSETALRSAAKAFMWRIIAGSITFATSLQFSGSVTSALSIVGSDFGSKMATMFIGERMMNSNQAGRESGSDAAARSLVKALVWRLFAIANSLTMAIFITKDLSIASKIAGSDAICKTGLMFAYERAWAKVEWGKKYEHDDMELTFAEAASR